MKVIITATEPHKGAKVDARFGRCAFFMFTDQNTQSWESHPNPAMDAPGGAGTRAAQFITELGANAVISGHFGPNAFDALQAAGIKMYRFGGADTPEGVVAEFQEGKLQEVNEAGRSGRSRRRG